MQTAIGETTCLHLGIGPSGNLDDHVQDGLLLIGEEGDVVKGGDGNAILFNVDTMLKSVGCSNLAGGVGRDGFGVEALLRDGKSGHDSCCYRSGGRR